ncbi:hypothetical protein LX97_02140 [Nonlabens dokdonensis]|jgi:hypothetical protein|uniref:MORN motif-containing protein n=2 Tax=Nonlabens dokdonensis TaxID=328515 RepID=L7WBS1_NONDD|nr:MORN motif-containing protein [Nonlabens dokdonensis]AGC77677.1 MORN motif-containing protein [Nonlabens dokdonensis DSW-6]PZX39783.1 hypothetical protein LX97_02140 [Nonlabens dokdonensis]
MKLLPVKPILAICLFLIFTPNLIAQKVDFVNAPRNPIGFKAHKKHFNLEGDIFTSAGKLFLPDGKLVYNYGTRYYYENDRIVGNNYEDTFEYDAKGNIIKFKYKNGSTTTYGFNEKDLLVYEKNTYDEEKTHTYDSKDRIISTTVNKNGVFYQKREFAYKTDNGLLIIDLQYTDENGSPGFKGSYVYKNGYLVKEIISSGTYEYAYEFDKKGNKIDFFAAGDPDAKHYTTYNRYYSDKNKNYKLEYGYYQPGGKGDKLKTAYIDGVRATDLIVSKGVKPNEKIIYDPLKLNYYSVSNVFEDDHDVSTRIEVNNILSTNEECMSYAYDGKFINYVHGKNMVKSREFSFLGPHMIDYRVEKSVGLTYIIDDYKNQSKSVKKMRLLTDDEASIVYTRELEKDNFFIIVKGEHIDYKKARFEYLENGDPVIFINDVPLYILTGFKNAKNYEVKLGKPYEGELDNRVTNETTKTVETTSTTTDYQCVEGDCKEGWGRVVVNDIITDATFINSEMTGVAYITYPSDSYYHGEYVQNRRSGVGIYKWTNGNRYIGKWKDGKQHGYGFTMNKENQITSAGLFENGKLLTSYYDDYNNGKSTGNCTGNCFDGFGMYSYNNGDKYWGFFSSGKRAHIGIYSWNNGSIYTGSYMEQGKRTGYGMYSYVDGSIFKGMFIDDRIDGLGVMQYKKTGNVVQGVFNNKGAKVRDY